MIGANGIGTEALKNLILPGVGLVTILDNKLVDEEDLKSNFFLTPESVGKPRHSETLKYLLELNPDVKGQSSEESLSEDNIKNFTLVIATELNDFEMRSVGRICESAEVPVIYLRTYG